MNTRAAEVTNRVIPTELEAFIRRVVREELEHLLHPSNSSLLDYWLNEGPDDPEGDAQLLKDAIDVLEEYGDKPETWISLEDLEAELDRVEAAGELQG